MEKIYILQKDLPQCNAGAEFKPFSALAYGIKREGEIHIEYANHFIENNPEWFKLKEEAPKEEAGKWEIFERKHPSQFGWDAINSCRAHWDTYVTSGLKARDESNRKIAREQLETENTKLKHELEITDKLNSEMQRIFDVIPPCGAHGKSCIPSAIEWVNKNEKQKIMEEGFYIPEINDFRTRYEYQRFEYNGDTDDWQDRYYIDSSDDIEIYMENDIKEGKIRVKKLDRQDVEDFGWFYKSTNDENLDYFWDKKSGKHSIIINYKTGYTVITVWDEIRRKDYTAFVGNLKNKSELLTIQKMIRI